MTHGLVFDGRLLLLPLLHASRGGKGTSVNDSKIGTGTNQTRKDMPSFMSVRDYPCYWLLHEMNDEGIDAYTPPIEHEELHPIQYQQMSQHHARRLRLPNDSTSAKHHIVRRNLEEMRPIALEVSWNAVEDVCGHFSHTGDRVECAGFEESVELNALNIEHSQTASSEIAVLDWSLTGLTWLVTFTVHALIEWTQKYWCQGFHVRYNFDLNQILLDQFHSGGVSPYRAMVSHP
ncbi:hypothetical protein BXZ70DRAFT_903351 [Cristinia sonorae]|uniref:Uncharacterized protein n=1 Tax=Cristinia sonorae TaxID=1940300 RepID=A0A8K0UYE4_9AGAR|nr:hypothetical protein BXZ70DRAFT_903351 [Cristinia sonorae]